MMTMTPLILLAMLTLLTRYGKCPCIHGDGRMGMMSS